MTKEFWLDLSEVIDALRVVPRLILLAFASFTIWYVWIVTYWYMALPVAERTLEASGFAGTTIAAVIGLCVKFANVYMTGPKNGSGG